MIYSKIYNPITKKFVNIKSKQGKKILETYINQNGGGMTIDKILQIISGLSCPISHDLMVDPVIISSGITFERAEIEHWLSMGKRSCPSTNIEIIPSVIIDNIKTRECIIELKKIILEELKNLEMESKKFQDRDLYDKTQAIIQQLENHSEKLVSWEQNRSSEREAEKRAATMPKPNTLLGRLMEAPSSNSPRELSNPLPSSSGNRPIMFGTNPDRQ